MAAKTRNSHFIVGGSGWAVDLTSDFNSASVDGSITPASKNANEQDWIFKCIVNAVRSITVGNLYTSTRTDEIRDRKQGYAFLVNNTPGLQVAWDGGISIFPSLSQTASTTDYVLEEVVAQPNGDWYDGTVGVKFDFTSTVSEFDIPSFTNIMDAFLVVTEKSAGTQSFELSDGSNAVTRDVDTVGVYPLALASLAAGTLASATLELTLSSPNTSSGWLLLGTKYAIPNPIE